jgi:hypothetical protein
MWSAVLVGAVAVMISGSSSAYAQQREGEGERGQNPGFSNEDRTLAIDSRIASRLASLKERLRLTPEQAKNWPAYEAAFQAVAKLRRERMEAGQERPSDPVQRMRQPAILASRFNHRPSSSWSCSAGHVLGPTQTPCKKQG